ncbi:MAG: hypothetical protein RMI01_05260 [Thermodesulfovibrio sp.]|nr:hypothetical protein [Thermodesulfovibrio sp.]
MVIIINEIMSDFISVARQLDNLAVLYFREEFSILGIESFIKTHN